MADFAHSILAPNFHFPENRPDLEALIEAAIARLDALDGDADLEDCDADLEDGGDDELPLGWSESASIRGNLGAGSDWLEANGDEEDSSLSEDDRPGTGDLFAPLSIHEERAAPAVAAVESLRNVQKRRGEPLTPRLQVVAGCILR